jgi:hypothetical protein
LTGHTMNESIAHRTRAAEHYFVCAMQRPFAVLFYVIPAARLRAESSS